MNKYTTAFNITDLDRQMYHDKLLRVLEILLCIKRAQIVRTVKVNIINIVEKCNPNVKILR